MNTQAKLEVAVDNMPEAISPFHLAQVATAVVGRKVYGPMLYTLVSKGYIPAFKDGRGKTKITGTDASTWLTNYVNRGTEGGRTKQLAGLLTEIENAE